MNKITRLAAAFALSGLLLAAPAAQAAPALLGASANFELEVNEMELEITADAVSVEKYRSSGSFLRTSGKVLLRHFQNKLGIRYCHHFG